jgi:hypothetical protein
MSQTVAREVTTSDLDTFVGLVSTMVNDYYAKTSPDSKMVSTFSYDVGPRYVRIVTNRWSQTSVYCFVERLTGAILKSASWKAPAKHARGNIFAPNPLGGLTQYGAEYMR